MLNDLLGDLHTLQQADIRLARVWLSHLARRVGLFIVAGFVGTLALGLFNFAAYIALETSLGLIGAAIMLGCIDLLITGFLVLIATSSNLERDVNVALEGRRSAIERIANKALAVTTAIDVVQDEVRAIRESIGAFIANPIDTATQKLLIPAAMSVLNGMRAPKKDDHETNGTPST